MKKLLAVFLAVIMAVSMFSVYSVYAAKQNTQSVGAGISFKTNEALYAHAVVNSDDTEAWQAWQSSHNERFMESNPTEKYFFLPSSADSSKVDIYNAFSQTVTVNGVSIASGETKTVDYSVDASYQVTANGTDYTLKFMKSNAEAAVYINNSDADGKGTELMQYLNYDKSNSAKATGAIVNPDGSVDNTTIKKIKGRGNTTWDKPKKAYNITYDAAVSVGTMSATKKFSILANYQDDSLSRNRFLYDLSDAVGMPYASDSRYVDFYANGFYWGSYQMTQKVDTGKTNLLSDIDDTSYINADGTINKDFDFVIEVDSSAGYDDYYFESASGNKITIKSPELAPGDPGYEEVLQYVQEKVDAMFKVLLSRDANVDVSQYVDIDSVTKLYLINELGKNWDSGVSSTFFTYKKDENGTYKFYGSPVWDYDNSLGNAVGVWDELNMMGIDDYQEYSGWWCRYKGKDQRAKSSNNVMNNIARKSAFLNAAPKIWFEEFVPAINTFMSTGVADGEFYSSDVYFDLINASAEMNYKSGWLLNTGSWIADHSMLKKANFDYSTGTYTVDKNNTSYQYNFEGMFNYAADWLTSRAAWLSSQMYADYIPDVTVPTTTVPETTQPTTQPETTVPETTQPTTQPDTTGPVDEKLYGDADGDGRVSILDATLIQKHIVDIEYIAEEYLKYADVDKDDRISVLDATEIQKYCADLSSALDDIA